MPHHPDPLITPLLLRDLHTYAVTRLERGEGVVALRGLGITDPTFVASYRIGFVPAGFRRALAPADREAVSGLALGGRIIVPAFDEQGAVVDLLSIHPSRGGRVTTSLFDEPRGLLGAAVITAFDRIIVTDGILAAARFADQGERNVLVLRAGEAAVHARRLAAAGVVAVDLRCHQHAEATANALRSVGIAVQVDRPDAPPSAAATVTDRMVFPPREQATATPEPVVPGPTAVTDADDTLVLVDHDRHAELAELRAGDITYVVQVPWDDRTLIDLRVTRACSQHRGEVDVAVDPQRRRFAVMAGQRLQVSPERIIRHLAALHELLPALVAGDGTSGASTRVVTPLSHGADAKTLELLRSPDLLDRIVADLAALGWHANDELKRLLWLVSVSRKLAEPVWALLTTDPGADPPVAAHMLAMATPPEDCLQITRLSDNALLHADRDALVHRLLVLDDVSRITPAVATTLRVLHASGAIGANNVERDPVHGAVRTSFFRVTGPVAVIGAASGKVHPHLASCFIEVPADSDPAEAAAALEAERRRRADPKLMAASSTHVRAILDRLHALQRLIEPLGVVIPNSDLLAVAGTSPRARREQQALLGVASASALLHQHQRLRIEGCVVATADDIATAQRLSSRWSRENEAGLSRSAARVLQAMRAANRASFTMANLAELLPGWTRHAHRTAIDELITTEFVIASSGGRGRLHYYQLVGSSGCHVMSVGELARPFTNFSPTSTPDAGAG